MKITFLKLKDKDDNSSRKYSTIKVSNFGKNVIVNTNSDIESMIDADGIILTGKHDEAICGLKEISAKRKYHTKVLASKDTLDYIKRNVSCLYNMSFYAFENGAMFELFGVRVTPFKVGSEKSGFIISEGCKGKGSVVFSEEIESLTDSSIGFFNNVDNIILNSEDKDIDLLLSKIKLRDCFKIFSFNESSERRITCDSFGSDEQIKEFKLYYKQSEKDFKTVTETLSKIKLNKEVYGKEIIKTLF